MELYLYFPLHCNDGHRDDFAQGIFLFLLADLESHSRSVSTTFGVTLSECEYNILVKKIWKEGVTWETLKCGWEDNIKMNLIAARCD